MSDDYINMKQTLKKKIIAYSAAALIILGAGGVTTAVMASSNGDTAGGLFGMFRGGQKQELTDAQKADLKAKMDAINAALDANDYNAWVTAVKAENPDTPLLNEVTADNFSAYVAKYNARKTAMASQKAKTDAVKAAIDSGDYTAWVTAVTAINANSPLLSKINSGNFSTYTGAMKAIEQANATLTSLGVGGPEKGGMGMDFGMMHGGRGHGGPDFDGGQNADAGTTSAQ
jgi:hypothetical protein